MDLNVQANNIANVSKPHVCGDGPPAGAGDLGGIEGVNPTYVGMDRQLFDTFGPLFSKPHVCGDGPRGTFYLQNVTQ